MDTAIMNSFVIFLALSGVHETYKNINIKAKSFLIKIFSILLS